MTVQEATDWIRKALTDEYRRACFKDWLANQGKTFVDQVRANLDGEQSQQKPKKRMI